MAKTKKMLKRLIEIYNIIITQKDTTMKTSEINYGEEYESNN